MYFYDTDDWDWADSDSWDWDEYLDTAPAITGTRYLVTLEFTATKRISSEDLYI